MVRIRRDASTVALIGDLVGSRQLPDRAGVQQAVTQALTDRREADQGVLDLDVTVGDEFQGRFATLGAALDATLQLRLALHGRTDIRFGIGGGAARVVDPQRRIEDGPAWWAARAAIEECARLQEQPATRLTRTVVRIDAEVTGSGPELGMVVTAAAGPELGVAATTTGGPAPVPSDSTGAGARWTPGVASDGAERPTGWAEDIAASVNAALVCRDHLVGSLDDRGIRILHRLLWGASQLEIAESEGISPSAVSQRVRSNGIGAVMVAHEWLRRVTWPGSQSG